MLNGNKNFIKLVELSCEKYLLMSDIIMLKTEASSNPKEKPNAAIVPENLWKRLRKVESKCEALEAEHESRKAKKAKRDSGSDEECITSYKGNKLQEGSNVEKLEERIKELEHKNEKLKNENEQTNQALKERIEAALKEKEDMTCMLEDFKELNNGIRVVFHGPQSSSRKDKTKKDTKDEPQQSRKYKMPGGSLCVKCQYKTSSNKCKLLS